MLLFETEGLSWLWYLERFYHTVWTIIFSWRRSLAASLCHRSPQRNFSLCRPYSWRSEELHWSAMYNLVRWECVPENTLGMNVTYLIQGYLSVLIKVNLHKFNAETSSNKKFMIQWENLYHRKIMHSSRDSWIQLCWCTPVSKSLTAPAVDL